MRRPFAKGVIRAVLALTLISASPRFTTAQAVVTTPCALRAKGDTIPAVLADSAAPKRWNSQVRASIARHEICVGMSRDMMVQSWGLSHRLQTFVPNVPGDSVGYYYYQSATVVVVNSVVKAIRPPPPAKGGKE
jgi:hypothetical protein